MIDRDAARLRSGGVVRIPFFRARHLFDEQTKLKRHDQGRSWQSIPHATAALSHRGQGGELTVSSSMATAFWRWRRCSASQAERLT
jgi:hypothetical protein